MISSDERRDFVKITCFSQSMSLIIRETFVSVDFQNINIDYKLGYASNVTWMYSVVLQRTRVYRKIRKILITGTCAARRAVLRFNTKQNTVYSQVSIFNT